MAPTERNLAPVAEIFSPVATYLETATTVTSYFSDQSVDRPAKRWDWEPTGGSFEGASRGADHPRALHDVKFGVDIHCRAATFDEAWTMLEQLVTALVEKHMHAFTLEGWRWADDSGDASTQSIVLSVSFALPVFEQLLGGTGYEPKTITAVGFDTSAAMDPDGILHTPKN